MAGYADVDAFRQGMNSSKALVPCMLKQFGVEPCQHCDASNELFSQARSTGNKDLESKARSKYFKKQYYGFGILNMPTAQQHGQVCLVHFPTTVFTNIFDSITNADPRLRWGSPEDLNTGAQILVQKYKKDAEYSAYRVSLDNTPSPMAPEVYAGLRGSIPDIKNVPGVLYAYNNWPAQNKFIPANDMKDGDVAGIRLLPPSSGQAVLPFLLIHFHYVDAISPWDSAWREANYDISKAGEIMAKLGIGAAPSPAAGAGGYAANAPGPNGVAAPGLAGLTGGAGMYGQTGAPGVPGTGEVPF